MNASEPKVCDNCANAPKHPYPTHRPLDDRAWSEQLTRDFVEMQGKMHAHIARVRAERDELQRQLNDVPSIVTALQDRVALLESLLSQFHSDTPERS